METHFNILINVTLIHPFNKKLLSMANLMVIHIITYYNKIIINGFPTFFFFKTSNYFI